MPCYHKRSDTQRETRFDNTLIASSLSEKLLSITLDSELKFEGHINKICNIVNRKLNALHCITNHISLGKQKMLLRAFIESQFSYCPLIWMICSRTLNNKINRLHGKALRIVFGDYKSKFDVLLGKDGSFSIHHRYIQTIPIEIFNFLSGLSPQIMNEECQVKSPVAYCLKDKNELYSRNPKTATYGTELVSFMASKIWSMVPQEFRNYQSLHSFKKNIRKWKPICRRGAVVWWLSLLHNFFQQNLQPGSVQVQILFAGCRRFAMVQIFDSSLWK